jgi:hypothetical protein
VPRRSSADLERGADQTAGLPPNRATRGAGARHAQCAEGGHGARPACAASSLLCLAGGPWPLPDKLGHEAVRRIWHDRRDGGPQTDRRELAGADLIARILGGRADATDTECSPDATHDFNIIGLANNRVVALEITSAVDPSVVSQLKAAFDQEWSFPGLPITG